MGCELLCSQRVSAVSACHLLTSRPLSGVYSGRGGYQSANNMPVLGLLELLLPPRVPFGEGNNSSFLKYQEMAKLYTQIKKNTELGTSHFSSEASQCGREICARETH